jgi:hypothetical protein
MGENTYTYLFILDIFKTGFLLLLRELNKLRGLHLHYSFGRLFEKR